MAADILYITFDGVLQPLGFSQVARVVAGLSGRGLRYHLLSLERPADLDDPARMSLATDMLRAAGVGWTPLRGGSMGTPRRAAEMLARVTFEAGRLARREGVRLVHARGYHSAFVSRALKRLLGIPYLFDARGYWIEERSGPGAWFSRSTTYAAGKFVEQGLFRDARAVVTLTDLQALDLSSGLFGPPPRLLEVIPTCADYDAFALRESRPTNPDHGGRVPESVRRSLGEHLTLGIVGSLNGTYLVRETLRLAALAIQASPSVHLLVLSSQRSEYEAAAEAAGIPPQRRTIAFAEHWAMPDWLQWIDWGLLLVPESAANRAKMPTKLAEFFATGVRPAFYGCNSDAARWVERAGSGHVLPSTQEADLSAAARVVADSTADASKLRAAREVTAAHFSLNSGLDRYQRLVRACLSLE